MPPTREGGLYIVDLGDVHSGRLVCGGKIGGEIAFEQSVQGVRRVALRSCESEFLRAVEGLEISRCIGAQLLHGCNDVSRGEGLIKVGLDCVNIPVLEDVGHRFLRLGNVAPDRRDLLLELSVRFQLQVDLGAEVLDRLICLSLIEPHCAKGVRRERGRIVKPQSLSSEAIGHGLVV